MYYNIKIKSEDSEFSLESNDKNIIEREMDIYFAQILGASEDFISKFKKIEIKSPDVRSIEDLNSPAENIETKIANRETVQEPTENKTINEPKKEEIKELTETIEPTKEIVEESQIIENNKTEPTTTVEFQKEEEKTDVQELDYALSLDDLANMDFKNKSSENKVATPVVQEIKQQEETPIVSSVEKEIEKTVLSSLDSLIACAQSEVEKLNIDEAKAPEQDEFLIALDKNHNESENIQAQEATAIQQISKENTAPINETNSSAVQEVKTETSEINFVQTEQENIITQSAEENPAEKTEEKTYANFDEFIQDYNSQDLPEQFLICAYYIKHFAKQENFTMKYINSILFRTVEKIADLSIVEGLIGRDFIQLFKEEDYNKYSITQDGEKYFNTRFKS